MLRATSLVRRLAVKSERVVDTLVLDHETRGRRRVALTAQGGLAFLLDLDRPAAMEDGDALKLEDDRLVRVVAAPERLIEVRTGNPLRLMKVAWHLGNRHVAAEITADALYIGHDHVLLEMVRGLGASALEVTRPFRPERGAYEGGGHGGGDGAAGGAHGHDGAHAQHGAHAAHEHGPDCDCGHDHGALHHHEDLRVADHGHGHLEPARAEGHDHGHAPHAHAPHAPTPHAPTQHMHGPDCGCGHDHGALHHHEDLRAAGAGGADEHADHARGHTHTHAQAPADGAHDGRPGGHAHRHG